MRLKRLIIGDIKFQFKYGFYFIYVVISAIYVCILSMLTGDVKSIVGTILTFSDPAALGMFFMGAILLLEKSQRVLNSIAVSPVNPSEYILSKVVSLGLVSTVVGVVLAMASGVPHLTLAAIAIFLTSSMFTLLGLIAGAKVKSLNQYIMATVPFELLGFVPAVIYLLGNDTDNQFLLLYPGCAMIRMIYGDTSDALFGMIITVVWNILLFLLAKKSIAKMFQSVGGIKL